MVRVVGALKKFRITRRTGRLESLNPDFNPVSVPARDVRAYAVVVHLPRVVQRTVGWSFNEGVLPARARIGMGSVAIGARERG